MRPRPMFAECVLPRFADVAPDPFPINTVISFNGERYRIVGREGRELIAERTDTGTPSYFLRTP